MECSAKYIFFNYYFFLPHFKFLHFFFNRFNYKVGEIFRELMGCTGIGCMTDYNQAVREKSKCNIL